MSDTGVCRPNTGYTHPELRLRTVHQPRWVRNLKAETHIENFQQGPFLSPKEIHLVAGKATGYQLERWEVWRMMVLHLPLVGT